MSAAPAIAGPTLAVLKRELLRLGRRGDQLVQPVIFYGLVAVLFPFALGTQADLAGQTGPAAVWIAVLLASTLSLEEIFRSDFEDGSLEQFAVCLASLPLACAMKSLSHWLTAQVPLVLMAAATAGAYGIDGARRGVLVASLLLGTPVFSLVGTVASALTVGARGGALLLALLIVPLYIPILIFGAGALHNASLGLPVTGELYFLGGLAVLAATLGPLAAAAGLRARLS
jgi:heme exporter protein B